MNRTGARFFRKSLLQQQYWRVTHEENIADIASEYAVLFLKAASRETTTGFLTNSPKNKILTCVLEGHERLFYKYLDCSNSCSCYNWEDGWPLFCDVKGFKLGLYDKKIHTLEMVGGVVYQVLGIEESTHRMNLVRKDILNDACLALQQRRVNTTLNTTLFTYRAGVYNLTLSYHCDEHQEHEFSCPHVTSGINFFPIPNNVVELFLEHGTNCSEASVQVPVLDPFVSDWEKLEGGLRNGFWVDYTVQKRDKDPIDLGRKFAIAFGTALASVVIMLVLFYFYLRRKKRKDAAYLLSRNISSDPSSRVVDIDKSNHLGVHLFSYFELEEATNKFDSAKELGDGGFGTVYYGKLRDGRAVAVKRLYEHNFKRVEQFMNEVEILTRLRHKNLVSLYGCTSRHGRELLLVYEYVSNGTVADHLHGDRAKPGSLPLPTRLKIAVETANALSYLHASDIIHRDVKTNNILLDEHFCVKVADFGLSRLFPTNVTHVSTAPQGTPGYVDPDYHQCYQLTDKSDVYSFGVVLIELISSMPAVDITRHRHEINLSNLAIGKIQGKAVHELVDPALGYGVEGRARRAVDAVAELAFGCLQGEKDLRPSMVEALEALRRIQSEMCDTDEVVLSPGSAGMGWSSSNDTTPNASL